MRLFLFTVLALVVALLHPTATLSAGDAAQAFSAALHAAKDNPGVPLTLQVQCTDDSGVRSMAVYPGGALIWGRERQARLDNEARVAVLNLLLNAYFADFDDSYGGKRINGKTNAPVRVLCSIQVQAGEARKHSYQDAYGERSEAFMQLASALLDRVEPLAANGVTAGSLDDGLDKLADGTLAPEALMLHLLYMPADTTRLGTILDIESAQISRRDYRPGIMVGKPETVALSKTALDSLLAAMREARFPEMPGDLVTDDVYQLKINILQHQHSVRSRPDGSTSAPGKTQAAARLSDLAEKIVGLPEVQSADGSQAR